VLRGRFDRPGETGLSSTPATIADVLRPTRHGLRARLAVGGLLGGIGLLSVAEAPWAHGVGVACLFAAMILGFLAVDPAGLAASEDRNA
jgi:hypothetical protein